MNIQNVYRVIIIMLCNCQKYILEVYINVILLKKKKIVFCVDGFNENSL